MSKPDVNWARKLSKRNDDRHMLVYKLTADVGKRGENFYVSCKFEDTDQMDREYY